MFSNELARRYGNQGIVSTALHPGAIKTEISRHHNSLIQMLFVYFSRIIPATPDLNHAYRTYSSKMYRTARSRSCTLEPLLKERS
jgi:NAD(P)-dependent dehydrogenase (short-subunit alcohol dehydrogenase family)